MIMVDELRRWPNARHRCFLKGSCHLTTDGSIEELYEFAAGIDLRIEWFQPHSSVPHYDLSPAMRARAINCGAVEVSAREQARRRVAARLSVSNLPTPQRPPA